MIELLTKFISNRYTILASRIILGVIFIWAAVGKIGQAGLFADVVDSYWILPYYLVNITAIVLPWIELFCGVFLIIGFRTRGSALLAALMLAVFLVALGINVARGVDMDCGCFGLGGDVRGLKDALWMDLVLLALGLQILRFHRPFVSID